MHEPPWTVSMAGSGSSLNYRNRLLHKNQLQRSISSFHRGIHLRHQCSACTRAMPPGSLGTWSSARKRRYGWLAVSLLVLLVVGLSLDYTVSTPSSEIADIRKSLVPAQNGEDGIRTRIPHRRRARGCQKRSWMSKRRLRVKVEY